MISLIAYGYGGVMSGDTQLPELPELTEATPYFLSLYLGFLDCSLSIVLSSVGARALALVGVPVVSDCIVNLST